MIRMKGIFRLSVLVLCLVLSTVINCGEKPSKKDASGQNQMPAPGTVVIRPGLWIVDPPNQTPVPLRAHIAGTISNRTVQEIWVVVHSIGGKGYWVQPKAVLRQDGIWMCQLYIGLPDTPSGVKFEVRAFAKPKKTLQSGEELNDWPDAELSSNSLILIRQ
ncbi:hypothetical protein CH330_00975 [candidate division WOR-3 bacterium JGI_Cruoil_03_51_56]|uniref:Bacterial spore germination immunoglobulin-like domain-containing protein n=1 Tax=candidate division WOR-3 bacterium JGI_Cruoil_03_51_56 TaxID=1973747 RepID=A0A235BXH6_UNCW3|nr:MAG: hypothetical protein CH330_00975 [candidate division WOR-3 bacterium JGI_Cruoil_03_51_56]